MGNITSPKVQFRRKERWQRFFRFLLLFSGGCLIVSLVTGYLLGNLLVNLLTDFADGGSPVTPIPMAVALASVGSVRVNLNLEIDDTVIMGEGIFVFGADEVSNFLFSIRLLSSALEREFLWVDQELHVRENAENSWVVANQDDSLGQFVLKIVEAMPHSLDGWLRSLGVEFSQGMMGWNNVNSTTIEGRQVTKYHTEDVSPLFLQQLLSDEAYIQRAIADITVGTRDNLPYQLEYEMPFDQNGQIHVLRLRIRLWSFNEPITLSMP